MKMLWFATQTATFGIFHVFDNIMDVATIANFALVRFSSFGSGFDKIYAIKLA